MFAFSAQRQTNQLGFGWQQQQAHKLMRRPQRLQTSLNGLLYINNTSILIVKNNLLFINTNKISQNMPAEYSNNIRLIISSYLIQNGAKLTKNKHQISPLDYLADAKMSDLLQKQCLAFEYE